MSLFANMKSDGLEKAEDRLGGFVVHDTDVYPAKIKLAFAGKSDGGAQFITFHFALEGGKEYRETVYFTNKKGENWFMHKDDKTKKVPLPGFTLVNDLCLIGSNKELHEQETEEKVINLYDREAKKELPTKVIVLTELLNTDVAVGIVNNLEYKQVKDSQGIYVDSDETVNNNALHKVYHPELKVTVVEAQNGQEPTYQDKWLEKNKGTVIDRTKKKGVATKPSPAPQAGGTATPARASLFGKKS